MALSDTQQSILMFIATALITINVYFATVEEFPKWGVIILGALSALAVVAKEQFGAKKAETAHVADGVRPA